MTLIYLSKDRKCHKTHVCAAYKRHTVNINLQEVQVKEEERYSINHKPKENSRVVTNSQVDFKARSILLQIKRSTSY